MKSKISLPSDPPMLLEVEFGLDGVERFWVDDNLVDTINSLGDGKKNTRAFEVNGHRIEIDYSFKKACYYSKVIFDGNLLTEHLFEETKYGASK